MSEFDTGYSVVIGKPLVHAEKKATGSSVSFPCEAIPDGSYLVSLEVNGTVKAYRESLEFSDGSCTVGDYKLAYSSYALTVSGVSNNDIVRVMVEPLEVKTTDAFRAAVKKDTPETQKCVVTLTPTDEDFSGTMDKTPQEITAAYNAGQEILFNVVGFPGFDHIYIPTAWCTYATNKTNCAACATLVEVSTGLQIIIVTSDENDVMAYYTTIYTLTPAT